MKKNYSREAWDAYYDFEITDLNDYAERCFDPYDFDDDIDLATHSKIHKWNALQSFDKEMNYEDEWYLNLMKTVTTR